MRNESIAMFVIVMVLVLGTVTILGIYCSYLRGGIDFLMNKAADQEIRITELEYLEEVALDKDILDLMERRRRIKEETEEKGKK